MRQRLLVLSWPGRVLLAGMVLMTLAAGLCLFDGDEHGTAGDGASFDLCLGLAITSVAAVMFAFVTTHDLPLDPPYVVHAAPLRGLDPPPRSLSVS